MAWEKDPADPGWEYNTATGEERRIGGTENQTVSGTESVELPEATADQWAEAQETARLNNQTAKWNPYSASFDFIPMSESDALDAHLRGLDAPAPQPGQTREPVIGAAYNPYDPASTTNPALAGQKPKAQVQPRAAFGKDPFASVTGPKVRQRAVQTNDVIAGQSTGGMTAEELAARVNAPAGQQGPGSEAADLNREHIDKILGGLDTYANDIYALSKDNTGLSVAEAQLKKAQDLAKITAASNLQKTQAGALGAARSARSRGDRALLERQAVGEQAYLGQEAQRQDVQRQAEFEGNQAILRATEEDADRRFRLDALGKASELGLNTAALEVDISKADLDSATNWVNQQFNQLGIDKQINSDQAKAVMGFTRDMAALQFQYDQLTSQEQAAADQLLMQKYGIDETTRVALKKIKEDGKFQWDQVLAGVAGGIGGGLTGGIAGLIGGGGKKGE